MPRGEGLREGGGRRGRVGGNLLSLALAEELREKGDVERLRVRVRVQRLGRCLR